MVICDKIIETTAELSRIWLVIKYIANEIIDAKNIIFERLISKFNALAKIILILDQTIRGKQNKM